jgi:hypothetical protein
MLSKHYRETGKLDCLDCGMGLVFIIAILFMLLKPCFGQSTCNSAAGPIIQNIYAPQCYAIQDTSDTLDLCFTFTAPGSMLLFTSAAPANCDNYTISATLYDSACNLINPSAFGSILFVIPGAQYVWCGHYVCTGSSGYHNLFCPSYSDFSPIPVTWIYFFGKYNKISGCVDLQWATASEINCDHFEVEYSTDAERWWKFDQLQGAGNSTETHYYKSQDCSPGVIGYYRIKQLDYDGTENLSTVISTVRDENPQPAIKIYDITGRVVSRDGNTNFLLPGIYIVEYNNDHTKITISK